jgi:hypothetical protein
VSLFTEDQRRLQDRFDTRRLADVIERNLVAPTVSDDWSAFIERQEMVFVASVDAEGRPACSYKGGDPGFVRVVRPDLVAFPLYDGNGLFVSAGNMAGTGLVELLFVDFRQPQRLRVGGMAEVGGPEADELVRWPEARLVVRVAVRHCYVNCARYVHRYTRAEASPYVPRAGTETPVAPWKLLPYVEPHLSAADRAEIARRRAEGRPLPAPEGSGPRTPEGDSTP